MSVARLKDHARIDADETAAWYAAQGGFELERAFIDALQAAFDLIRRHSSVGSTRYAEHVAGLPSPLRFLPLARFEHHLVHYMELPDQVEVIRVWHASRGLDALGEGAE